MIIVGVAGYLIAFAALNVPDADWVRILSFVPFFSPYLIPTRMVLGYIAPWEIGLAFVLLLAGAAVALLGRSPDLLRRCPALRPEGRPAQRLARRPRQPLVPRRRAARAGEQSAARSYPATGRSGSARGLVICRTCS